MLSNVFISVGKQILLLWSSLSKSEQIIRNSQRGGQTFAHHSKFKNFSLSQPYKSLSQFKRWTDSKNLPICSTAARLTEPAVRLVSSKHSFDEVTWASPISYRPLLYIYFQIH